VSLTNLISSQKEGVDFQGKIDNKAELIKNLKNDEVYKGYH
jgi:hypothetical protein